MSNLQVLFHIRDVQRSPFAFEILTRSMLDRENRSTI